MPITQNSQTILFSIGNSPWSVSNWPFPLHLAISLLYTPQMQLLLSWITSRLFTFVCLVVLSPLPGVPSMSVLPLALAHSNHYTPFKVQIKRHLFRQGFHDLPARNNFSEMFSLCLLVLLIIEIFSLFLLVPLSTL